MEQTPIRPHEMAAELMDTPHPVENGWVRSERLGSVIDRSQGVWRQLIRQTFDNNEHGHVTFTLKDSQSDYTQSGDHVDAIEVVHNSPRGNVVRLGGINRVTGYSRHATAYTFEKEKRIPLLPDDRHWDAVVGTIERAIDVSWEAQRSINEERHRSL